MTIVPLMTLAGAAAGGLAVAAAQTIDSGLDFLSELNKPEVKAESPQHVLEPLPPVNFKEAAQAALERFQKLLGPKLAALGIDTSLPMTFTVDSLGAIKETSGHPQAQQIEQVLATEDEIARSFREASCNFEVVRACEEHMRFSEVYAKNPELAVQQFSHLFDGRDPPKFSATLLGDKAEITWQ